MTFCRQRGSFLDWVAESAVANRALQIQIIKFIPIIVNIPSVFSIALLLHATACLASGAERLYWDMADAPGLQGGKGTWSTEAKNWSESADGAGPRVAWRAGMIAVFRDTEKCLVLAEGPLEVGGIEAAALDLAGGAIGFPASGIEITSDGEITLSSAVRGDGPLLKHGKGVLSLAGMNSLPAGITLKAGKLRFFSMESLGQGAVRVDGAATLAPGSANMNMSNPVSMAPGSRLTLETEAPDFTLSGPISGGGELEKSGRGALAIAGSFEPGVQLIGSLGNIRFAPRKPVKLNATINGGLLRTSTGSLSAGSRLLITQAGALAASGACDGVQTWVESGWIAPESNGTLAWDGEEEVGGTIDLTPFVEKYPAMSMGSCGKTVVTGRLEIPGTLLRIGGGGGDLDIRSALTGPLQLIIGAPSTVGNVTLSGPNTFTAGLRIDGGTLRIGHAEAIPAEDITMGNRFTHEGNCQLDLNNFDLPNSVKMEGRGTIKNSGGGSASLSGTVTAGPNRLRLAADDGSVLKLTGVVASTEIVIVGSDKAASEGKANLVELAPPTANSAARIQVERGTVLRAVDGLGLPTQARLLLLGGVFESHGKFNRPHLHHKGARDGAGGVTVLWDPNSGSGFSAHGGAFTVRFVDGNPWFWGTQADGSAKPGNYQLVLNAPTADSLLTLDIPLDLAGEEVDRKKLPTPLHRISVQAAEAMLTRPVTNSGAKPAGILKLGNGILTLNAANSYTDKTVIREGTLAFGSPSAIAGSGRTICPENGSVVAANFPIDNAFLKRLESASAMAFTVALGADSSAPLDFNSDAGAILRAATLGATREASYSGILTPCDNVLRFGGGGGALVVKNAANIPTTVGGTLTSGHVILPEGTSLAKDFVLLEGSLNIGSKPYESPEFSRSITPPPVSAEPPTVTASATDRWVDAAWSFPINPEGGFAVEWSQDGEKFQSAGNAWPEERRFPIFLKDAPGKQSETVFVRVAAIHGNGARGAWSVVANTPRALRFDPEKQIPARFAGSADQRKYNANDPERLTTYTPEEQEAQRVRAKELAVSLKSLSKTEGQQLTIPPGVYRVNVGQFAVEGARNLTIRAPGVEIIVDDEKSGGAFSFNRCEDVVLTGRAPDARQTGLTIDSEQLAFSLARIVAINTADMTLDVEVLPGYDMVLPEKERMLAFRPDGSLANIQQTGWEKYQSLGGRMLRLSVGALRHPLNQNRSLAPGNLLTLHTAEAHRIRTHGLASTRYCRNMTYESIRIVNGSGSPADHRTAGHTIYRDWRNSPRPGTNRLEICAGLGQFSKNGGTFLFEDCEFGPHLDDGINLLSILGMTLRQSGANTLVLAGPEPKPGESLAFYDFYSWNKLGEAKIVSSKPINEVESAQAAEAWCMRHSITSHALRGLWSVTLESPLQLSPFAPVVYSNFRCDNITVRGCLFRDQVAQIMLLQGARSGLIENNLMLRSTGPAISMQFAQYWWEGPQPSNFIIRNNVIRDNPVHAPVSGDGGSGSISVWANTVRSRDSGRFPFSDSEPITERLFSGFRIEGNTIINPGGYGILLRNTRNAVIRHNKIVNAGAVPTTYPVAAIGLDQVSDTLVSDNKVIIAKGNPSKAVSLIGGCDPDTVRTENNQTILTPEQSGGKNPN
jgi:autotransporter-associated beta strand protein